MIDLVTGIRQLYTTVPHPATLLGLWFHNQLIMSQRPCMFGYQRNPMENGRIYALYLHKREGLYCHLSEWF